MIVGEETDVGQAPVQPLEVRRREIARLEADVRSPETRSSSSRASASIGSSENSAQTVSGASGALAAIVVASMSTPQRWTSPSEVTTAMAWRWRKSGCDGTTNPVT